MADSDARTAPRRSWWRTAFADVWDRRAAELRASASARDRFARGHQAGNPGVGLAWAGEGTHLITAVEPTGNLAAQIVTQTERLLRGTSRLAAPDPVRRHPRGHIAQFCTSRPKITTGSKPAPNNKADIVRRISGRPPPSVTRAGVAVSRLELPRRVSRRQR